MYVPIYPKHLCCHYIDNFYNVYNQFLLDRIHLIGQENGSSKACECTLRRNFKWNSAKFYHGQNNEKGLNSSTDWLEYISYLTTEWQPQMFVNMNR